MYKYTVRGMQKKCYNTREKHSAKIGGGGQLISGVMILF